MSAITILIILPESVSILSAVMTAAFGNGVNTRPSVERKKTPIYNNTVVE